ncbi:MAG: SDR family oxidoreductase [Bradyrhizobiaceae bacterium]|nr:MAG: SDR family oxidoreductase [Bradyrhizobiaceae bacterium]
MTDRVTLITGASSGIGAELARIFAAAGHKVALVARRADRLTGLAASIEAAGGPQPVVIACDLQDPGAGVSIAGQLEAQNLEVDFLVNNAGFGLFGQAAALDREQQLAMVDLNVRALTDLSLRFSGSIVRHKGGILNVASIAAFMPGPSMAVYYASKAFVLSFTEALRGELGPKGVKVTALCPGPVPTEFQDRAGFAPGIDSAVLNVSARDVAQAGYRGLMKDRQVVLPGVGIRMIPFFLRFTPRNLVLAAVSRVQGSR